MPEKKTNVLTKLIYIFCPKKTPSDNIVVAADRIIENYIFNKNKLIRKQCNSGHDKNATRVLLGFVAFLAVAYLAHVLM